MTWDSGIGKSFHKHVEPSWQNWRMRFYKPNCKSMRKWCRPKDKKCRICTFYEVEKNASFELERWTSMISWRQSQLHGKEQWWSGIRRVPWSCLINIHLLKGRKGDRDVFLAKKEKDEGNWEDTAMEIVREDMEAIWYDEGRCGRLKWKSIILSVVTCNLGTAKAVSAVRTRLVKSETQVNCCCTQAGQYTASPHYMLSQYTNTSIQHTHIQTQLHCARAHTHTHTHTHTHPHPHTMAIVSIITQPKPRPKHTHTHDNQPRPRPKHTHTHLYNNTLTRRGGSAAVKPFVVRHF